MRRQRRSRTAFTAAAVLVTALTGLRVAALPVAPGPVGPDAGAPAPPSGVGVSTQEGEDEETLRMAYARAESLVRTGSFAEAMPLLTRVVSALGARAETGALDSEASLLLVRSLAYRAEARLRAGNRGSADDDLRRMIEAAPNQALPEIVSNELRRRYEQILDRTVGYLDFGVTPEDATLVLDGTELSSAEGRLNLSPGAHVLVAERPGYRRETREVEIRAGRREQAEIALRRLSAVVRLRSRPPGTKVVVDDDVVGATRLPPGSASRGDGAGGRETGTGEPSAEMVVEGLMPGEHVVELSRPGYRTRRARFSVPGLSDYDLGVLELERERGVLVLRGVPRDARVVVDGQERDVEWSSTSGPQRPGEAADATEVAARLHLSVGQHRLFVGHRTGVFEERVELADRQTRALEVRLRPGVTFLGVLGDEEIGVRSLTDGLADAFRGLGDWVYLDRIEDGVRILRQAGFAAGSTGPSGRRTGVADRPFERSEWERLRSSLEAELPGSLYVGAVLADRAAGRHAELWILPSSPGPARPERFRVPLDTTGVGEVVASRFAEPLPGSRPWFGALLVDSAESASPVVASVAPGGPAEAAGLRVGDRVVAIGNRRVGTAAAANASIAALSPSSSVVVEVEGGGPNGDGRVLTVRLGSSPVLLGVTDPRRSYAAAWAVAQAELHDDASSIPRWVLQLDQALILLRAGAAAEAADRLAAIRAPGDSPLTAAVAYWHAVALLTAGREAGPDHLERARRSLHRASEVPNGRLGHNDGPLVAPRAAALLEVIGRAGPDE